MKVVAVIYFLLSVHKLKHQKGEVMRRGGGVVVLLAVALI